MSTHAEAIAKTLVGHGVEYVFGLPGGEITAFMDACRRSGIRFILTGHESSAAIMAQVLGQIKGIPGVCAATLGPGATNLVTGVANAYLDRAPLLAFTAQLPTVMLKTMTHQRVDLNALFSPVTKKSVTIGTTDTVGLVEESLVLSTTPRPGPVHLSLPSDVATSSYNVKSKPKKKPVKTSRPRVSQIEAFRRRIEKSKRPLIIWGLGMPPAAAGTARQFVEMLGCPFLVTPKVKGILPEDHPLFLGVASGMALDRDVVETIRMADLLIGIGFDPVECDNPWFAQAEVFSIDFISNKQGGYRPVEMIGDITTFLERLMAAITESRPWPQKTIVERRRAIYRAPKSNSEGVSPLAVIECLRDTFPKNGIVTCDVGAHKLALGQFWRSYEPGTFFMSNGLSGMGFGIPAAVAAQLAHPNRPVMAIVGDGGMLMTIHDLALIRELGLPVILICLTDSSLTLIKASQLRRGLIPYGVDFQPPDFAAVATAFGIQSRKVNRVGDIKIAVERALEQRRPAVIDVQVNSSEYFDL